MTLAISTSSPLVSIALIDDAGSIVGEDSRFAPRSASSDLAIMARQLTNTCGIKIGSIGRIAVDVGPGGFTGVRVGVAFAKALSWGLQLPLIVATSFDLIGLDSEVAVPFKKGQWLCKKPGLEPTVETVLDFKECNGYGEGFADPIWPRASRFQSFLDNPAEPKLFAVVPYYGMEPSISQPKSPRVLPRID